MLSERSNSGSVDLPLILSFSLSSLALPSPLPHLTRNTQFTVVEFSACRLRSNISLPPAAFLTFRFDRGAA